MSERFDLLVLGGGPAGEVAVNAMLKAEKRVAVVERELIGGECTNWGCIPSKTLLHPPELRGVSSRTVWAQSGHRRGLFPLPRINTEVGSRSGT